MLQRLDDPTMRTIASIEGDPPEAPAGGEAPPLTGPPAEEPPSDAAERVFTQAEMDAIIGERLRRDRATRAPVPPPVAPAAPAADPSKKPSTQDVIAEMAELKARVAFAETLAALPEAAQLSIEQREAARRLFDPANPAGMADTLKLFAAPVPAEPAAPAEAPASNGTPFVPGAAPAAPPREQALNILAWDKSDIAAVQQRGEFRQKLDEYRASLPGGAPMFSRHMPRK